MNSEGRLDNGKEVRKQCFLNENTKRSEARVLVDDRYRIVGLSIYNHGATTIRFVSCIIKLIYY